MDARGLDATHSHEVGWRGQILHEGEKCEPRDTAKDAVSYLVDLASDELRISQPHREALLMVSGDFHDLLVKINNRYLRKYPN
jgi:hypothetical protein